MSSATILKRPALLWRLFFIFYIIARHGIDRVMFLTPGFTSLRFLSWFNPWNWLRPKTQSPAQSVRLALQDLGPIFVKFGQILSTRPDLLPEDFISELQKLQDQVPPFSSAQVIQILQNAYGRPLAEVFKEFAITPLASASIAQVHEAVLPDGRRVVVKVRRPQIEKIIHRDIGLLHLIARLTERFWSHGKRLRAVELVKEFESSIIDELDFMREAANASQLRRNFRHSASLYIPEIFWDYCFVNVIVMEQVEGIPISNKIALTAAGVDLKKLAQCGVDIFFTQVFRDGFFHADMHPGNIFVAKHHPESPQYIAVDFGIVGSLSPGDQHYLAENMVAFFKRDYRRVAQLHVESGWVPPNTRVEAFEAAIRSVCEPVFEKPLRDISFAQLLLRLFQTASRFKMEVQPQLFLLQKTLLNVEGLGRELYPELDLWATGKPFLERFIKRRYSPRRILSQLSQQAPGMVMDVMSLPSLWRNLLEQQKKTNAVAAWQARNPVLTPKRSRRGYFFCGVGWALLAVAACGYVFLPQPMAGSTNWSVVTGGIGLIALLAGVCSKSRQPFG